MITLMWGIKIKSINIMQLRFFCQTAHCGSITRAANDLFRTQSAITRAIRELEITLDATLFERHYSGMVLTDYGKCILPRALRAIRDLQDIPALLAQLNERVKIRQPPPEPAWLFNTRRLQIFLQLYHANHTQIVAAHLGVTQPAISAAMKTLEKGSELPLFHRTPEGMRPTAAAALIYPNISRSLNELEHIWQDLAARRGILTGKVRIGALPLSRSQLLPKAISAFLAQHPNITIMTNESPYESLVSELRAGNIDFIIGALRQNDDLKDLAIESLFEEDMVILVRSHHPLLDLDEPVMQLEQSEWILPRSNTPSRYLLDKAFSIMGLMLPTPVVETGDAALIRELLLNSDRVAAVSASQMRFEIENDMLSVLPVKLPETKRHIGLTFRQGNLPSPATKALLAFIHQQIQD